MKEERKSTVKKGEIKLSHTFFNDLSKQGTTHITQEKRNKLEQHLIYLKKEKENYEYIERN